MKITLKEADYQPQVSQKVKEYSKKAQLKGFRPGKVPIGLVKKMYGKSILVDEVNQILSSSISNYIKENDLKILGDPLPNSEKNQEIDWDNQSDFEFEYNIGLVEDFKYEISKKKKITSYSIKIDDKMLDEEVENIRKNYGNRIHPEQSEAGDMVSGELTHAAGDINNTTTIYIDQVEKKEQKKFLGLKVGNEITFDLHKAFKETGYQARMLGISVDELQALKDTKVSLKVEEISRIEPAALEQEFYDKLFGKDQIKSEQELRDKIKEFMGENFERETDQFLIQSIRETLVGTTKMDLPEKFLKKWLVISNQGKVTEEDVEKEYPRYAEEMKWNLILNKIAEDNEVKVENEEVVSRAKDMIRGQLASSGLSGQMEDQLDVFADNYLKGEEGQNYLQVFNQVRNDKIMDFIRHEISVAKKEVNLEQFRKAIAK
ncbi:MAG: trigger factor [Cyclobacteriaceae bacterium]|nr:trigger factor [Cyclobacteriaceae bacterium]